ncbi:MAG: FtsW/RodA/SpoVE family cell cycle protein [Flammeovirgaceae bacterium]
MEINLKDISKYLQGDKIIWGIAIVLSLFSILVVYSATSALAYKSAGGDTEHFLMKHAFLVMLGLGAMWLCHRIDYRYYSRISRFALIASVALLLFALNFGATINEASRWIVIPFVNQSFQPSDLAKLALLINMASMLSKRQNSLHEFQRAIVPMMMWAGVICGLIAMSDWSGGLILFITCALLMFIGRVPLRHLGTMMIIGLIAGAFAFSFGQRGNTVSSRLKAFTATETEGIHFHTEQANIAIALGGFTGVGAGRSIQRNFLPNPFSDFIFAIIVEEYGFLGALAIISLYLILLYRGMLIVARAKGVFGGLLAAGITFSLILQVVIHMAVNVNLLPITGLPLPLLSMGGTSLLFTGMAIGIVLSVSRGVEKDSEVDLFQGTVKHKNLRRKVA